MKVTDVDKVTLTGVSSHYCIKEENYGSAVNSIQTDEKIVLRDKVEDKKDFDYVWAFTMSCSENEHILKWYKKTWRKNIFGPSKRLLRTEFY